MPKVAAESDLKRATVELDEKSPLWPFDNADLDPAVSIFDSVYSPQLGQAWFASSRTYVYEAFAGEFLYRMK